MAATLASYGLYGLVYFLEVALVVYLLREDRWKRQASIFLYVACLFGIDGVGRSYVLLRYGVSSSEYAYFFWITDIALLLAAFLVVCALFRRACRYQETLWRHVRLLLTLVFILVLSISLLSLHRNYENLFSIFIVEFQQNLYFTCLILLTLLYVLMQKIESTEDELTLLVSGLGIQFAGPAANLALVYLTPGQQYARMLWNYLHPLCTLGMLSIWLYALTRMPKAAEIPAPGGGVSELAEAVRREA